MFPFGVVLKAIASKGGDTDQIIQRAKVVGEDAVAVEFGDNLKREFLEGLSSGPKSRWSNASPVVCKAIFLGILL